MRKLNIIYDNLILIGDFNEDSEEENISAI